MMLLLLQLPAIGGSKQQNCRLSAKGFLHSTKALSPFHSLPLFSLYIRRSYVEKNFYGEPLYTSRFYTQAAPICSSVYIEKNGGWKKRERRGERMGKSLWLE